MRLETTRFGAIDIDDESIITFTRPIIGFQEYRRFTVLPGPESSGVVWLQSTESGELAFIMMDPRTIIADYTVKLSEHELSELAVASTDDLDIYTLVVVPADQKNVRTNLKAPVLINPKHRLGKQMILDKSDYPVQYFLGQHKEGEESPEEVSNARPNA